MARRLSLSVRLGIMVALGLPALWVFALALGFGGGLGPDPGQTLVRSLGLWALRLLLLTLTVGSLSRRTPWRGSLRFRRMLGVATFVYATIHLLAYATFILQWDWASLGRELTKRPYIVVGSLAWLLLLPLAATSTDAAVRRLRRHWRRLHCAVYVAVVLVLVHFAWQLRSDYSPFLPYFIWSVVLGVERLLPASGRRKKHFAGA